MKRHYSSSGFTLIELLTVIAIIAILASVIFVGLGQLRESSRRSGCAANLRQTGLFIQLWTQDNKGRLPGPLYTTYGPRPSELAPKRLDYTLRTYVGLPDVLNGQRPRSAVFECPTWASEIPVNEQPDGLCYVLTWDTVLADGTSVRPFGYPAKGTTPASLPVLVAQISNPAKSTAITDLDAVSASAYAGTSGVAQTPVHGKVRNSLYFDGHVAAIKVP